MTAPSPRQLRAAARRAHLLELAEQGGPHAGGLVDPVDDRPPVGRTVAERLAMVAEASAIGWALTGRPMPAYDRASMPGRVLRDGEPE